MAVATGYILASVEIDTIAEATTPVVVKGVVDQNYRNAITDMIIRGDGIAQPVGVYVDSREQTISLTTTDVAALSTIGVEGKEITNDGDNRGVVFYLQKITAGARS